MAVYARTMAEDNSAQIAQVKRNLARALREDVTPKQRQALLLYYGERLNMPGDRGAPWRGQVHGLPPTSSEGNGGSGAACAMEPALF